MMNRRGTSDLDTKDGISLLGLKNHVLLSYLHALVLLCARRALGHSLNERSPPTSPFSSAEPRSRGSGSGDLVDSMIESRLVLEKIKALEGRMRYQIEKLVRMAEETPSSSKNLADGACLLHEIREASSLNYDHKIPLRSSPIPRIWLIMVMHRTTMGVRRMALAR